MKDLSGINPAQLDLAYDKQLNPGVFSYGYKQVEK